MGYTPGTPEFDAAERYYADMHYINPALLAKYGLDYYVNSPAVKITSDAASKPIFGPVADPLSQADYFALNPDNGFGDYLNYVQGFTDTNKRPLNWYYDINADISWIPLREGESLEFYAGDEMNRGHWSLQSPSYQNYTRGLSWSDVRGGIEYVGTVLAAAYIGGEFLTPAVEAAPEALGIGADIGVDVATDTASGLIGTETAITTEIAPTVYDTTTITTDIAPTVADVTPSLTDIAGEVKAAVGTVTTVEKLLNPAPPKPIQNANLPSVQVPSPSPNESGEISVVALLGLLLFKVI